MDRGYHHHHPSGRSSAASVASNSSAASSAGRGSSTPRKEKSGGMGRDSSAVQDPGLKDYRLGECLGKGAFGSVYKGFNWGTGEAVAVKQIKLIDVPKSELRMIESEIDLLKNLNHDNIVKYIGFVKSVDCLNIILEYCENGSLHSICKSYGKFPENLVGVYMTQVLQGLQYLHDQGVIHRDIKGANILTTKDGTVKLADFGVSTSTISGGAGAGQDNQAQVVGTPYWMAPEIIQLSGASPASDIWSVGCTVIELLQGRPPYHNLAAMPALFAIVNDDHPPLPEGISAAARDFLMQCFQKDPNLRVSARKLLRHAWIGGCRRSDAPVSKAPSNFNEAVEEVKQWNKALKSSESSLRASTGSDHSAGYSATPHASQLSPEASPYSASVASSSSSSSKRLNLGISAKRPLSLAKPRPFADAFRSPELADDDNWDNDFATSISPTALQLPHLKPQDNFGGLLSADRLKAFASMNDGQRSTLDTHYDDEEDPEGELLTIKAPRFLPEDEVDFQEHTIRPFAQRIHKAVAEPSAKPSASNKKGLGSKKSFSGMSAVRPKSSSSSSFSRTKLDAMFERPTRPELGYREQTSEDFDDLFVEDDNVFERGFNLATNNHVTQPKALHSSRDKPQLFHPSDLKNFPRSIQSPVGGSTRRQAATTAATIAAATGTPTTTTTTTTTSAAAKNPSAKPVAVAGRAMRRTRSSIEIQRFAENDDDEDFSDIFGPEEAAATRAQSEFGSEDGAALMIMSKQSGSSWLGDDEDEHDPFASMDPGWDEMDLEANIARDRHARLCEKVEELVRSLKTTEAEDTLSALAEEMLSLLCENREMKTLIISAHGLLPILEILETCTAKSRQYMILQLLKVVNAIILDDVEIQENLCFVGGIPIITKFAARQFSNDIRLQAAAFVRQMYQTSTLTLQMFVSAGGLNVLVEFLDEDYDTTPELVLIGVNGVWNVFELQGPTPKNDFCRIFSRSKILYPLALVLHRVLDEDGEEEIHEMIEGRIVNIFYLFSQAENYVKEVVADRMVLKSVLKDLRRMTPVHQVTMLKFIKNLSMLSTTLESLHSADAIEFLIDVLSLSLKKSQRHFREISNQVLNTLFNLCRLSKERQEDAAVGGIIPLLMRIMRTDRPPKEFALPILCDMAHSGSKGRRYLWQNKGLDFYVSLLADQYWQVTALDAILIWLQEETANVENHLVDGNFTNAIISCFSTNRINAFDSNLLEPLLKLLRLSPSVAATLATPEMFSGIAQRFGHKKAVVRLNLLRLVRDIIDSCEPHSLGAGDGTSTLNGQQVQSLMDTIQSLAEKDAAVLVRNLASELVKTHIDGNSPVLGHDMTASNGGSIGTSGGSNGSSSGSVSFNLGSNSGMATSTSSSSNLSSRRSGSGPRRRNTSYTSPNLLQSSSSTSLPQTPTQPTHNNNNHHHHHPHHPHHPVGHHGLSHAHRSSIPSLISAAGFDGGNSSGNGLGLGLGSPYMEALPSPRRTTTSATQERESLLFRPRSRDGPTGIPRRISGDGIALLGSNNGGGGGGGGSGGNSVNGGSSGPKGSRLPRNAASFSRSRGSSGGSIHTNGAASTSSSSLINSTTPMVVRRSDSSSSIKENAARSAGFAASGTGASSPLMSMSALAVAQQQNQQQQQQQLAAATAAAMSVATGGALGSGSGGSGKRRRIPGTETRG